MSKAKYLYLIGAALALAFAIGGFIEDGVKFSNICFSVSFVCFVIAFICTVIAEKKNKQ